MESMMTPSRSKINPRPCARLSFSRIREKLNLAQGLGLIFDLDGVIIDSMPFHQRAWQRCLEVTGIGTRDSLDFMHGQRNEEIVRGLLGPEADSETVIAHGAAKEQ